MNILNVSKKFERITLNQNNWILDRQIYRALRLIDVIGIDNERLIKESYDKERRDQKRIRRI